MSVSASSVVHEPTFRIRPAAPSDAADTGDRIARALRSLPKAGDVVFGFRLERELGRGAFGRVFLATQPDLAGRPVALKVSADLTGETRALALLQHTNIVPVYSVHRADGLQAACMPFLGAATVADLLAKYRAANSLPATGRELVNTLRDLSNRRDTVCDEPDDAPLPAAEPVLALLSGFSYVRAACWLAARAADGLAHAHDRGILHRDVKPANVLVTADGQPMLLDFGVAEEVKLRATAGQVGGTLPYMAPEHLDEVLTGRPAADSRSDVYSLGLVLYELLTGRYPFPLPDGRSDDDVRAMIAARRRPAPDVRRFNRDVSPGLESIVRTCLAADPAGRYPSAAALRDDLDRHLADQPLLVAAEPSVRERAAKWARRHPRLSSNVTLGAVAAGLLAAAGAAVVARNDRIARLEASDNRQQFAAEAATAQYRLTLAADAAGFDDGLAAARSAVGRYGLPDDPKWDRRPAFTALPEAERGEVRQELANALLILARGRRLSADADAAADGLRLNELAERVAGDAPPRTLFAQRASILRQLGRDADAAAADRRAADTPLRSARDYQLAAADEQAAGRHAAAVRLFEAAAETDPKLFWAHFGAGVSLDAVGKWADARGRYTAAIALWPEPHWTHFNRGLVSLRLGDHAAADTDFTNAVARAPGLAEGYFRRALARQGLGRFAEAVADVDKAQELGTPIADAGPLRTLLRRQSGDPAAWASPAAAPATADDWVRRGVGKLPGDPAAALADFERALALDPDSLPALINKAHVFGETGREAECVTVLDRVLALEPGHPAARAGRAVMHARLKHWPQALADAREVLAKNFAPVTVYQVAGVYARLTEHDPAYLTEAVTLLGIALRAGFGFEHLATDPELDPIRKLPAFENAVREAGKYRPTPGK